MKNGAAELIEINPKVMLGKPVVCGTRITVELLRRSPSLPNECKNNTCHFNPPDDAFFDRRKLGKILRRRVEVTRT